MKREILNKNKKLYATVFTLVFFLLLLIFVIRLGYLCISGKVDGIDLRKFAKNRNTTKETLYSLRGSIYDVNGNILAQTVNSYSIIAYLSKSRGDGYYVKDKEMTAEKLSTLIDLSKDKILEILNKDAYQVEFGTKGKGLTEIQKENIENLKLDGIDFITTHKRYYPNNDFLSYVLGYATTQSDGNIVGQMGIEKQYDALMTGKNGYVEYQKDLNGYKFPNSNEIRKEKLDGNDVYLTIDSNVQMSLETTVKQAVKAGNPDWMVAVVLDAKTGKILGSATSPSFDPNTKEITNYLNPLVSYTYEPGSVMKTYTFMAAFEDNKSFNTDATCTTGPYEVSGFTINDWNKTSWGTIPYQKVYTLSSNTGVANLIKNYLTKDELLSYFKKMGFGKTTGIELPNEYAGKVNFKYDVEVVTAGFGQGITTTPIQQVRALTAIANNGVLLEPYIVDKVVNPTTKEVVYKAKTKEGAKVASLDTVNKMKDLMYNVVNWDSASCTGYMYKMDGYDLIGKTGTAQIANAKTGKYYDGKYDYVTSFAGMYPKNDPKVIIYVAMQRNKEGSALTAAVKSVVKDTAKYLGVFDTDLSTTKEVSLFKLASFKSMSTLDAKKELDTKGATYIVFGNGTKVIDQYPKNGTNVNTKEKIFLFTNDANVTMPDLTGYSFKEAAVVLKKLGISYEALGTGYVSGQSVAAGTVVDKNTKVTLN